MGIQKRERATAWGLGMGLALGLAGAALGRSAEWGQGDHYQNGWTVLIAGKPVCTDPYVRPSEREIECRSAVAPR